MDVTLSRNLVRFNVPCRCLSNYYWSTYMSMYIWDNENSAPDRSN